MARRVKTPTMLAAGSDMPAGGWVGRVVPAPARPYARLARLDRPIGTWLLLFPCWWSVVLGSLALDRGTAWLFVLFAVGAVVMRGAGCTWNDITDRDIDAKVARTRTRPIPSGQVRVRQAYVFLVVLLFLGLAVLLNFNAYTIWLGVISLSLLFTYPLMKRITYWPQIVLGLAFNWGALMGWAAVNGVLDWPALALYGAGICWTLGYDTIYAHQDKEDDLLVGVKSTALRLGGATRPALAGFYAATIALMGLAGDMVGMGGVFFGGLALGAAQLAWQVWTVDIDDAANCLSRFRSNRYFGWIVLAGLAGEHYAGFVF